MNADLIAKLGALAIGAISTFKLAYDWLYSRKGRLRDEYKFAREFFADLKQNVDMHPFLKQRGYQALAGDVSLTANEIEYVLTLNDSAQSLHDFTLGKPYLTHFATAKDVQITFLPKYKSSWSRRWRKAFYFVLYFFFFMGAFAPLYLSTYKSIQPSEVLPLLMLTFPLLTPSAFWALRANVCIACAEKLVSNQQLNSRDSTNARTLTTVHHGNVRSVRLS